VKYTWSIAPIKNIELVDEITRKLNIPQIIARILVDRGIETVEKAKAFFKPAVGQLYDPFLMDGMEAAVNRTLSAVKNREKILIYGDYDVDGTNSIAMLYLFFLEIGIKVDFYVPDRLREGYGITKLTIDKFDTEGINLIITVDCGITSVEEVEYAKTKNIDVIICDHHTPGDKIPDAVAVINPMKENCHYPFKYLCGCGVAYKLLDAIARTINKPNISYPYLQFVAVSTMADIVPLVDENRVLTHFGLEILNEAPRAGFQALMEITGLGAKKISSSQVVFVLAPRINAVGRLGDATRAVELLICDDLAKAFTLAKVLEEENKTRSKLDRDIFQEAQELVEKILEVEPDIPIILHESEWHPGVIGIVASRLAEKYCRPTIMMTTIDGVAKGSARSVDGFDVYEALKKCEDKILQFGGHKYAAGLAVEINKLDEFREAFNEIAKKVLANKELKPQIKIDSMIEFSDISLKFREFVQNFSPYGPSNMRPLFQANDIEIIGVHRIGTMDKLRLKLKQKNNILDAICFNLSDKINEAEKYDNKIDIVFSIEEVDKLNSDKIPVQLKIRDLKPNIKTD
jgi:single-stranded-DNA-specific exonuclease